MIMLEIEIKFLKVLRNMSCCSKLVSAGEFLNKLFITNQFKSNLPLVNITR